MDHLLHYPQFCKLRQKLYCVFQKHKSGCSNNYLGGHDWINFYQLIFLIKVNQFFRPNCTKKIKKNPVKYIYLLKKSSVVMHLLKILCLNVGPAFVGQIIVCLLFVNNCAAIDNDE